MDPMAAVDVLVRGGPTAIYLIIALAFRWQYSQNISTKKEFNELLRKFNNLTEKFNSFQVEHAKNEVTKEDIREIKDVMRDNNDNNMRLIGEIFKELRVLSTVVGNRGRDT